MAKNPYNIKKNKYGTYSAYVSLGTDPVTNKRIRKQVSGKTKDEVEYKILILRTRYLSGELESEFLISFESIFFDFIQQHKKKVKITTFLNFESMCINYILPYFKNVENIRKIKLVDCEKFIEQLVKNNTLSNNRINKIIIALRQIFHYAEKKEAISKNPAKLIDKLPERKSIEKEIITPGQFIRLLNSIDETESFENLLHKTLASINYGCGFRLSELAGIQKEDIKYENEVMYIRLERSLHQIKGGYHIDEDLKTSAAKRTIIFPEITKLLVQELLNKSPYGWIWLFQRNEDVPPYNQKRYNAFIKKQCKATGLPIITSHNLRHSIGSLLLLESTDEIAIQRRMGHSKIEITQNLYGHVVGDGEKRLVDKLNEVLENEK